MAKRISLNGNAVEIIRRLNGGHSVRIPSQSKAPTTIYISNYARNRANLANPDIQRRVRISRSHDRYGRYDTALMLLAPSRELVQDWKAGALTERQYTRRFWQEVGPTWNEALSQIQDGDCLLCFCGAGKFCHRYLVADRLGKEGYKVILVEDITNSSDRPQAQDQAPAESPPDRT